MEQIDALLATTPALHVTVRCPCPADVPELARHFAEMQSHYNDPVTEQESIEAASFACCCKHDDANSFAPRTFLAVEQCGHVCGSIVLNVTFPATRLSRSLYVRDLYVGASGRRRGIARLLLRAAAKLTLDEGFCALDWTMDALNDSARGVYEGAGAQRMNRIYYRLAEDRLRHAAA